MSCTNCVVENIASAQREVDIDIDIDIPAKFLLCGIPYTCSTSIR